NRGDPFVNVITWGSSSVLASGSDASCGRVTNRGAGKPCCACFRTRLSSLHAPTRLHGRARTGLHGLATFGRTAHGASHGRALYARHDERASARRKRGCVRSVAALMADRVVRLVEMACPACRVAQQDFCATGEFIERGICGAGGFMTELFVEEERSL